MMSYMLSALILLVFVFFLDRRLGLIAAVVTLLALLGAKGMNKVSLREAAGRQNQSEHLTDAVLSFAEGIGVIKSYNLIGEKTEELTENFRRSRDTPYEEKYNDCACGAIWRGKAAYFDCLLYTEGCADCNLCIGIDLILI